VQTAPNHFLNDYPNVKWRRFQHAIPEDLSGKSVLDIGCNGGFYAIEMKRRGADRVLGVDFDDRYLEQARFAAEVKGVDIEFRKLSVYDVAQLQERFDVVLFMGVLYHLRHPLLALDLIHDHVAGDLMVFQSMQRGSNDIVPVRSRLRLLRGQALRRSDLSQDALHRGALFGRLDQLVGAQRRLFGRHAAQRGFRDPGAARGRGLRLPAHRTADRGRRGLPGQAPHQWRIARPQRARRRRTRMIEAVKIWNEPNNKSHWDPNLDPEWDLFAQMTRLAGQAIAAENSGLTRVLGGMSPIDPAFLGRLEAKGALDAIDAVAVHGFPLDWNLWGIDDWPAKLAEIQAVTDKPVWVTEVGVSSFGSEEVQAWGVRRTAELLIGRAPRIHWYSLYDLPRTWEATTRHKEAEGSSYYRHFHMGLLREDGAPKPGLEVYADYAAEMGLCQWFHYQDHRLDEAVGWLKRLGVRHLRTGLSWADSFRPDALAWFDRQMEALEDFDVTVTFCFTPEHRGIEPHHTSPPQVAEEFAEFCAAMVARYAPAVAAPIARPTALAMG
jgi:beta-xylosidase/SAM-dependent methyltransferase